MSKKSKKIISVVIISLCLLSAFVVSSFAYGTTSDRNSLKYVGYYNTPFIELYGDRTLGIYDGGDAYSIEQPSFFYSDVELGNTATTEQTLNLIESKTDFRIVYRDLWSNIGIAVRNEINRFSTIGKNVGEIGNYYQAVNFGSFVFNEDAITKSPYSVYVTDPLVSGAEDIYQMYAIDVTYLLRNNELVNKSFYKAIKLTPIRNENNVIVAYSQYNDYIGLLRDQVPLDSLVLDYRVVRDVVCYPNFGAQTQLSNYVFANSYSPVLNEDIYSLQQDYYISLYQISDNSVSGNNLSLQEHLSTFVNAVKEYWQETIDYYSSNVGSILSSAWGSFANAEILPNITLGGIFGTCVAIAIVSALLKIFAF